MTPNELPQVVAEIGERIRTQDGRITSHPIFVVEERVRIYGMDPVWDGPVVWLHADEPVEVSPEESARLEAAYQEADQEPENFTRTGYVDYWRFVTACFTEQGCKDYIAANGHNL